MAAITPATFLANTEVMLRDLAEDYSTTELDLRRSGHRHVVVSNGAVILATSERRLAVLAYRALLGTT